MTTVERIPGVQTIEAQEPEDGFDALRKLPRPLTIVVGSGEIDALQIEKFAGVADKVFVVGVSIGNVDSENFPGNVNVATTGMNGGSTSYLDALEIEKDIKNGARSVVLIGSLEDVRLGSGKDNVVLSAIRTKGDIRAVVVGEHAADLVSQSRAINSVIGIDDGIEVITDTQGAVNALVETAK